MNRGTLVSFQRQRAGLSITELAEKIDMSVDTLEDIESNLRRPKVYELEAMAVAMDIPYWYLGDENPVEQRVYTYVHGSGEFGDHSYTAQGELLLRADPVREKLLEYMEADEYLQKVLKDYR
jgi:transcriptional regulator with XRE-family HTH domain